MTNAFTSPDGGKVALKKRLRRSAATKGSILDGIMAGRRELTSDETPSSVNVVPWANRIWDEEAITSIESRIIAETNHRRLSGIGLGSSSPHRPPEEWQQAYLLRFTLASLERKFEDEGLRPAFADVGNIPLPVAERWLLEGLGIDHDKFVEHIFSGKRLVHALPNDSGESMRFLAEITDFTSEEWERIEEEFFPTGWEKDFDDDEYSKHYGVRIRKHFLSNRYIPSELFRRLLHVVVSKPIAESGSFSGALGWMLSNAAFSTEGLKATIRDLRNVEMAKGVNLRDSSVDWELICSHPNWTPEVGELLSFHEALICGRRTRHPYSGCNLLKGSPCRKRDASERSASEGFSSVEDFLESEELRSESVSLHKTARDFILCPHNHQRGDLTKKVAMATLETAEGEVLPSPAILAHMMPGYGLARVLLEEVASNFENGDNIPTDWLKELL